MHICYIRVTEGKIEILKKSKMWISTLIFIYTIHVAYTELLKKPDTFYLLHTRKQQNYRAKRMCLL